MSAESSLNIPTTIELKEGTPFYEKYQTYRAIMGSEDTLLAMNVIAHSEQPLSSPDLMRLAYATSKMPLSQAFELHRLGKLQKEMVALGLEIHAKNASKRLKQSFLSEWESLGLVNVKRTNEKIGGLHVPDVISVNPEKIDYIKCLTTNVLSSISNPDNEFSGVSLVDIFGAKKTDGPTGSNLLDWVILTLAHHTKQPLSAITVAKIITPPIDLKIIRERCILLHDKDLITYEGNEAHGESVTFGIPKIKKPRYKSTPTTDAVYDFLSSHPKNTYSPTEILEAIRAGNPTLTINESTVKNFLRRAARAGYLTQHGTKEAMVFLRDNQERRLTSFLTALGAAEKGILQNPDQPITHDNISTILSNLKEKSIPWEQRKELILTTLKNLPGVTTRILARRCAVSEGGMLKYLKVLQTQHYVDHTEDQDTFRWRSVAEKTRRRKINIALADERKRMKYELTQQKAAQRQEDLQRRQEKVIAEQRIRKATVKTAVQEYSSIDTRYPTFSSSQQDLVVTFTAQVNQNLLTPLQAYDMFWEQLKETDEYNNQPEEQRRLFANLEDDCDDIASILFYSQLSTVKTLVTKWRANKTSAISNEEAMQSASLALIEAINVYTNPQDFFAILSTSVKQVLDETAHEGASQGLYLSLAPSTDDEKTTIADKLVEKNEPTDATILASVEQFVRVCDEREQPVIEMILQGKQIDEIAEELDIDTQDVEDIIISAGEKLRQVI